MTAGGIADPARIGETVLPDGRRLGWAEWGPPEGEPVLLCPGAATSCWLGFGADVLDELGVRLFSVDRPGLGSSDPFAGRPVRVRARGGRRLQRPRDGLRHRRALAPRPPRRARSAGARDGRGRRARPGGAGSADAHDDCRDDGRDGDRHERRGRPRRLHRAQVRRRVARALDEAFAPGAEGYARDTVLATAPWPFRVEDLAGARRHLVDGAGGAILWTHARDILSTLLDRTPRETGP